MSSSSKKQMRLGKQGVVNNPYEPSSLHDFSARKVSRKIGWASWSPFIAMNVFALSIVPLWTCFYDYVLPKESPFSALLITTAIALGIAACFGFVAGALAPVTWNQRILMGILGTVGVPIVLFVFAEALSLLFRIIDTR